MELVSQMSFNPAVRGVSERYVTFGIANGGNVLPTGIRTLTAAALPFSGIIKRWKLRSQNGAATCELDIRKNGTRICAAARPSLSADVFADSDTLTGWDTALTENDILTAEVISNTDATNLILLLAIQI